MTGACLGPRALAISAAADTSSPLPSGVSISSLRSDDKSAAVQTCTVLLALPTLSVVPKRHDWRTRLVENEAGENTTVSSARLHASQKGDRDAVCQRPRTNSCL